MELPSNKKLKKVATPELAAALDRTKTSDGIATFAIAETLKSVGLGPDVSQQTVGRKRIQFRQSFANNLKESFKADVPLTVHWDGKMMSDTSGRDIVGLTSASYIRT